MAFPITLDRLSLWEIAHRVCDKDPNYSRFRPIPLDVRDAIRSLMFEILEGRLTSSLFDDKERQKDDSEDFFMGAEHRLGSLLDRFMIGQMKKRFYIRTHIDAIYDCIAGHTFPRDLLKFVEIEQIDFAHWCDMAGYPKPGFWFGVHLNWEYSDNFYYEKVYGQWSLEELKADDLFNSFSQSEQYKMIARSIAVSLWREDKTRPASDIANDPQMLAEVGRFSERAIRNWIQPVSPLELRNKKGRPKKKNNGEKEENI